MSATDAIRAREDARKPKPVEKPAKVRKPKARPAEEPEAQDLGEVAE